MQKTTQISDNLYPKRMRDSGRIRDGIVEEFYSDKSRIVFCSSFRRLVQKAQVFSLESNTSVRNRLTHSLEVSDVGRTIALEVGKRLMNCDVADYKDVIAMQAIVENACLIHDIGNPPFGHFGEYAIKKWFKENAANLLNISLGRASDLQETLPVTSLSLREFDGNPQGFRIVTKLHTEKDKFGLNLTTSTLLATIKYPNFDKIDDKVRFKKKVGVFYTEKEYYEAMCEAVNFKPYKRYFLAYLMELADDICYCLSDISDAFEKRILDSRLYKEIINSICKKELISNSTLNPAGDTIDNFSHQVAIPLTNKAICEGADYFSGNLQKFITGDADEIINVIPAGKELKALKTVCRKLVYSNREVQSIEIAGKKIVENILHHYSTVLSISRINFSKLLEGENVDGLDFERRVVRQLSSRMVDAYKYEKFPTDVDEWIGRCHLIIDYVSGLTDQSALKFNNNICGIAPYGTL